MKVLVVGGGFGGLAACIGLRNAEKKDKVKKDAKPVEIVLVEPKDHVEVFWTAYRSIFDSDVAERSVFPLAPVMEEKSVQHVRSVVTRLTKTQATLANGDVIDFDVAVLATGATYSKWESFGRGIKGASTTREERLKALKAEGEKYLQAKTVLIVGGGLVGAEVAGDLVSYSKKRGSEVKTILVQSGAQLCPEMSVSAAKMVQTKLENLGVEVILNEKVVEKDGKMILQNSGKEIQADQVIRSVGVQPLNSFVDEAYLNDKGWIDVDEHYQVKGAEGHLFAVGDCCTLLQNSANQIMQNIDVIGANIKAVLDSKSKSGNEALTLKKPGTMAIFVCTVGPNDGVVDLGFTYTQYLLPAYKNRTFFLDVPKDKYGLKDP